MTMPRVTARVRAAQPSEQRVRRAAAVMISLAALSGCATVREKTGLDVPSPGLSTTASGALTGAALGAGLGAIVGSTSGDAGAGVAIGAAAGGLVGAGIGHEVQGQEVALAAQRDALTHQEQQLQNNRRDIEDLKRRGADGAAVRGSDVSLPGSSLGSAPVLGEPYSSGRGALAVGPRTASGTGGGGFGSRPASGNGIQEGYQGNPRAKPYAATEASAAGWSVRSASAKSRVEPVGLRTFGARSGKTSSLKPAGFSSSRATVSGSALTEAPALGATDELPPPEVIPAERVAKAAPSGPNCDEAAAEAERGLNAGSPADRLFYLRRAARLCPAEPTYHLELGRSYVELGKKNDARFEFRQAIDLDPENQLARDELSILDNSGASVQ